MALKKKIKKVIYGKELIFEEAYIEIVDVSGTKDNMKITAYVYDDENKEHVINFEEYSFLPNVSDNSDNFIKQGYEFLKTLDLYIDAINC